MVFGINVSGDRLKTPQGELDVWVPTKGLAEATGLAEQMIRDVLKRDHKIERSGNYDFVLRLRSPQEADALVRQLREWMKPAAASATKSRRS